MTGVRNGVLGRIHLASPGFVTLATVPAGFVYLVKTFHVSNVDAVANTVGIQLKDAAGALQVGLPDTEFTGAGNALIELWTALNAGDSIVVGAVAGNVNVWVAGAALPGDLYAP